MDITYTYCTSGSAVLENIRFKAGSIDPTIGRTNTKAKNRIFSSTARPKESNNIYYITHLASSIDGPGSSLVETVVSRLYQTILRRQATDLLDNNTPKRSLAVHLQSLIGFRRKRTASNSQCCLW